ncbi:MAG: hypothetical protein ACE15C_05995 [Phycisphaerae bacterium]
MTPWSGMFDGQLAVQPPLTDEQLDLVPAKRGVVALLADRDLPIVALTAADIRARVKARLRNPDEDPRRKIADLRGITRKVLWKLTAGHFETDLEYLRIARAVWPGQYASMLSWRPAWFVYVNAAEEFPHFVRTDDVLGSAGLYVGPFASGRAADRFIEAIQDAFDLCRDLRCLRQAPHGPRCSYGQMERCVCPCDGTMPMDEYRRLMARAADFAAGSRDAFRDELRARMSQAAAALEFERAAALKSRLERLAEFDRDEYGNAAPIEQFRFLLVQPGPSSRKARAFLADSSAVERAGDLDYPVKADQTAAAVERARAWRGAFDGDAAARRWRIGLVAHYLCCSDQKRGLILRVRDALTAEELAASVEKAAAVLHLRAPKPRVRAPKAQGAAARPAEDYNRPDGR